MADDFSTDLPQANLSQQTGQVFLFCNISTSRLMNNLDFPVETGAQFECIWVISTNNNKTCGDFVTCMHRAQKYIL